MAQSTLQFECSQTPVARVQSTDEYIILYMDRRASVQPLPQVRFAEYSAACRDTYSNVGCSLFIVQDILVAHARWH
jgi:hypothetical protein